MYFYCASGMWWRGDWRINAVSSKMSVCVNNLFIYFVFYLDISPEAVQGIGEGDSAKGAKLFSRSQVLKISFEV